jgi:hypothetical protein
VVNFIVTAETNEVPPSCNTAALATEEVSLRPEILALAIPLALTSMSDDRALSDKIKNISDKFR